MAPRNGRNHILLLASVGVQLACAARGVAAAGAWPVRSDRPIITVTACVHPGERLYPGYPVEIVQRFSDGLTMAPRGGNR